MIPSARDREVWGLLAAEPAFAFAGTRSRSVTVRSGGYEPPFCQYEGGTVAAVRKTNNFLCPKTRPFIRTQKRPHFALTGKMQAFLMLTFSDWRWLRQPTQCVQQYTSKKSRAFLICNLVFGKSDSPQIVCGAANLHRSVECIHNLQNTVHHQIPRQFSLTKRAWIRIVTASSSSFIYRQQGKILAYRIPLFTFW